MPTMQNRPVGDHGAELKRNGRMYGPNTAPRSAISRDPPQASPNPLTRRHQRRQGAAHGDNRPSMGVVNDAVRAQLAGVSAA